MSQLPIVNEVSRLTAVEVIDRVKGGDLLLSEYVDACLDNITRFESRIHAWAHLNVESTRRQAQEQRQAFESKLMGIPVGVKDVFNTIDMPTQMGSPIWAGFTPGNDARVVHYLKMQGASVLGKTVTAEFAVHTPGPTRNPHCIDHSPGTSSSGSAAAVAACMVPIALGTQTAGSIIRPASYCGVYGFKPSFGLIPRTGVLKTTDSLDTIGLLARAVDDLRLGFDVMRVHGEDYPISHRFLNEPDRRRQPTFPWRVAVVKGPKWSCAESYAQDALFAFADSVAESGGVVVEELILPETFNRAHEIHGAIYERTLAYYFKEEFRKHTLVSQTMYEMIERGMRVTLAEYQSALSQQQSLSEELDRLLRARYDVLINLSTGGEAPLAENPHDRPDNCLIWTLCGVPTINIPVFEGPNGLPFGAQIVSRRYSDYLLLSFARRLCRCGLASVGPYPIPSFVSLVNCGAPSCQLVS